jgi:hypothetical protein
MNPAAEDDTYIQKGFQAMRIYAASAVLLMLVLFAIGCSSDDPAGPEHGTGVFSAVVTGAIAHSFSGGAVFFDEMDPETSLQSFILWLGSENNEDTEDSDLIVISREGGRPATGAYSMNVANADLFGYYFAAIGDENEVEFTAVSGAVNVTASSVNRFAGDFNFVGQGIHWETQEQISVTVQGEFDAISGNFFDF